MDKRVRWKWMEWQKEEKDVEGWPRRKLEAMRERADGFAKLVSHCGRYMNITQVAIYFSTCGVEEDQRWDKRIKSQI